MLSYKRYATALFKFKFIPIISKNVQKLNLIKKHFVIICVFVDLVFFYMFVVFFLLFLGSNFNQQTNDEENPETYQLLLQIDKENDREGVYIYVV